MGCRKFGPEVFQETRECNGHIKVQRLLSSSQYESMTCEIFVKSPGEEPLKDHRQQMCTGRSPLITP